MAILGVDDLKSNIILKKSIDSIREKISEEQLKIVLPNQEDTYYYPKTTPLYSLFKRYLWECHPIMPQ